MTLREIQNLEVGDVIFVDKKIVDDVSVDLGTIPKFSGQLDRSKSAVRVCLKQKYD
jgi:flagellar motor switch protein FliM